MRANLLKKSSSGPKINDGLIIFALGKIFNTSFSPSPLVFNKALLEPLFAPNEDICISCFTPSSLHISAILQAAFT